MNTKYTNPALQQEPIGEPASIIAPRENESLDFRWIKSTGRFMPSQSERFNDDKEINESASNHNRRSPSKPQLHKYKPVCYEILVNIVCMKTKALNIRTGDRIIAFFKNKMQVLHGKTDFHERSSLHKIIGISRGTLPSYKSRYYSV